MNNIKSRYLLFVVIAIFIIGSVLSLTVYSGVGTKIRYLSEFLFILISIYRLKVLISDPKIYMISIFSIYPLLTSFLGIYPLNLEQILTYVIYMFVYTVFLWCIVYEFKDDYKIFINLVYGVLSVILVYFSIRYVGEISFNLSDMVHSIITNERYGNDLSTARISAGFLNVNSLGMVASLLSMLSVIEFFNNKHKIGAILTLIFSMILILNSGSRTPLIALLVSLICYFVYKLLPKNLSNKFIYLVFGLIFITWITLSILIARTNGYTTFFNELDDFLSYRLSYSKMAWNTVHGINQIFGIGPMSTTDLNIFLSGGMRPLDSSIAYYMITFGFIGALILMIYIFYIVKLTIDTKDESVISLLVFYLIYVIFENILFIPNSAVSTIILTIIFLKISSFRNMNNKELS